MTIRSDTKNLYVRLEKPEREAVEKHAKDNYRSVAAELRLAVRFYLLENGLMNHE